MLGPHSLDPCVQLVYVYLVLLRIAFHHGDALFQTLVNLFGLFPLLDDLAPLDLLHYP